MRPKSHDFFELRLGALSTLKLGVQGTLADAPRRAPFDAPKLGRVPTTYKQSAGAESLLIRRRALNESASVASAEHRYRPVSRSAPWRTCVLSASRSCAVSARQSFHSLYQRSPARADVFAVVLALL